MEKTHGSAEIPGPVQSGRGSMHISAAERHARTIGSFRDTSQPTISRYVAILVPIVKSVLEEFVPSAADAIEVVKGRVVLVDGTLTPCWSYEEHQEALEQETQDHRVQHAADIPSRRDCRLDFRSAAREDSRRESIQGDRGRRYRKRIRRRIRRQRLPGQQPGHAEEEAKRRRANHVRQGIQLPDFLIPGHRSNDSSPTSRTGRYFTQTIVARTLPMMTHSMQPAGFSSSRPHGVMNNALARRHRTLHL